jgi:hypothetical protein
MKDQRERHGNGYSSNASCSNDDRHLAFIRNLPSGAPVITRGLYYASYRMQSRPHVPMGALHSHLATDLQHLTTSGYMFLSHCRHG